MCGKRGGGANNQSKELDLGKTKHLHATVGLIFAILSNLYGLYPYIIYTVRL